MAGLGREARGIGGHLALQHDAVIRHVAGGAVVPFRVGEAVGQPFVFRFGRGQVEMQPQPGGGAAVVARQADHILVVGRLLGVLLIVVVHRAIEVQVLDPTEDRLKPVDDETVAPVGLVEVATEAPLAPGDGGRGRGGGGCLVAGGG